MQRLKTREQFQAVLAGARVSTTAHFALHRCPLIREIPNSGRPPAPVPTNSQLFALMDVWLGAMVPKRWAKRAVTRNTIKRQIYNVSSEYESALPVAAHVVRLRRGFDRAVFLSASSAALKVAVRNELAQLFSNATQNAMVSRPSGGAR